jgi:hypothetical protein
MKSTSSVPAAAHTESADAPAMDGQPVLTSRIGICKFGTVAGFLGCVLLAGWIGWYSATEERLRPLDTINPNTDPRASLVRLSGIGPVRAIAIVAYRDAHSQNGPAFRMPADLDAVAGLGPKTVEKMMPWISFDNRQPLSGELAGNGRMGD